MFKYTRLYGAHIGIIMPRVCSRYCLIIFRQFELVRFNNLFVLSRDNITDIRITQVTNCCAYIIFFTI